MKFISISFFALLLIISCTHSEKELGPAPVSDTYNQEIDSWVDDRIDTLRSPPAGCAWPVCLSLRMGQTVLEADLMLTCSFLTVPFPTGPAPFIFRTAVFK